jgi:glycosyltransferase involved in cell wall biosynthesis
MSTLRVAVIIPVFNGANTIARALDSVLHQTFDAWVEIVVVNDGSTDSTAEVLRRYGDRLRVLDQHNQGPAAARNAGVARSSAEYLAFLDADDAFALDKLARTVPHLANHRNAIMLFHDAIVLNREGREAGRSYVWPERAHAPSMDEMLAAWWPIVPSTVVMRRTAFVACGGFCEQFKVPGYEDPDLWIRARNGARSSFCPIG